MGTLKSDLSCRGYSLNVMASTVEHNREDPFSLLEDSDAEEAVIVVDSDNETDAYVIGHLVGRKDFTFELSLSSIFLRCMYI